MLEFAQGKVICKDSFWKILDDAMTSEIRQLDSEMIIACD